MQIKPYNSTKELKWDSDFFSMKIASIYMEVSDNNYLLENLQRYKALGFDLVYIFSSVDNFIIIPNITLVDCKVIYKTNLSSELYDCEATLSGITPFQGKPEELYSLSIQAGENSRYNIDPKFKKRDFERLYKVWIDNSIHQGFADKIFVFKEDDIYQGFITLKKKNTDLEIGLIATDVQFRGRGIARKLIENAKKYGVKNGCTTLSVATQKHNKGACLLYEKCGMSLYSQTDVYHAWLR